MGKNVLVAILIWLGLLIPLAGCDSPSDAADEAPPGQTAQEAATPPAPENRPDPRGLKAIRDSGYIRFLLPRSDGAQGLVRNGLVSEEYRRLARGFAESQGLEPRWVYVDYFEQLIPQLEAGYGDVIVTNLTATEQRQQKVHFTIPLNTVDELLIVPPVYQDMALADLPAMTITVPRGTSYAESVAEIAAAHDQLSVSEIETAWGDFDFIEAVADGSLQAAVVDSSSAAEYFHDQDNGDFAAAIGATVKEGRRIGWAVRNDNTDLLTALNHYLISQRIEASAYRQEKRDWPQIQSHKTLRLITSNNPASYFIWRGELMGFDYDLVRRFADQHNLRLQVVVRDGIEDIRAALEQGEGDLAAAAITVTRERQATGMTFSDAYLEVKEQLISRADEPALASVADLKGRSVAVNPDKSYFQTLQILQQQLAAPKSTPHKQPHQQRTASLMSLVEVPGATTESLIQGVAAGDYDFTLADSHLAAIESTYRNDIKVQLDLTQSSPIAFAVRPDQPELLLQLNQFIKKEHRGLFYNVTYNKYFKNKKNIIRNRKNRVEPDKPISPYDTLIQDYATSHGYDWRLITSQMYQESRFDPKAKSYAGARGLMQVLPRTAREFGYHDLFDPQTSIEAGVVYLDWLRERFPRDLPIEEQIYFMLAAYNAGHGHVHDARRLAAELGKDPDQWFGHVEDAMLLLSRPEYSRKARFGYVRGREPVNYVKSIRQRYLSYLSTHGPAEKSAAAE